MKSEYDIIVIGAGPGGSTTGRFAAEKGADVLVLEKRPEIGAPKRCGEGLSISAMNKGEIKPDPSWALNGIDGAYVYSPAGTEVEARYPEKMGYAIERKMFDKMLARKAADSGAEVRAGCSAVDLIKENGKIKGVKVKDQENNILNINSNLVVAADGVESMVARWAGIKSQQMPKETCSGYQFEMANIDFKDSGMLEFYMGNEIAPGGYLWVFPKGKKTANVGIGIRNTEEKCAMDYLKDFVKSKPGLKKGSILEVNGGAVPVGSPLEEITLDNFMIVGDAAHQVNAIHGGGIGEAMLAGKIAGKTGAEAVKKEDFSNNFLKEYHEKWFEEGGKKLKKLVNLRKVIESLSDKDLDFLAKELKGEKIIELAMGKKYSSLAKILAKRPSLLRHVKTLLGK
ncbi:MAG: NAD(P)/FAD-dependent oxidoreductase [Candidatus Undinarchaeales archaeon]